MADYIFSSTTCLKQDIYSTLKNLMISNGWTNNTSLYSSDFDVMCSTGESGDKSLVINIRPTGTAATNAVDTTDYCYMSYRLPETYVPGAVGVAGTFGRTVALEAFKGIALAPVATTVLISKSTTVTIYYHCNKNRIIFSILYPDASGISPVLHFIGLTDEPYVASTGSRGVMVASSAGMATGNSIVYVSNAVPSMPSDTASSQRTVYCTLPPKQLNSENFVILSTMEYGNATEGLRGKITGVFALGTVTPVVNTGNIITIDSKQYYIINTGTLVYNSFGASNYLAIQIA